MYDLYIAHNDCTFENNFKLKKVLSCWVFWLKNASKKWPFFVNIFYHKMNYNIFTGYLSIGKWYSIDVELSEPSISVFKVKICLEFGEILRPKEGGSLCPSIGDFLRVRPDLLWITISQKLLKRKISNFYTFCVWISAPRMVPCNFFEKILV